MARGSAWVAILLTLVVVPGLSLNGCSLRGGRWEVTDRTADRRAALGRGCGRHRPRTTVVTGADTTSAGENNIVPAPYEALYDQEALIDRGCFELAMMPPPTLLEVRITGRKLFHVSPWLVPFGHLYFILPSF